MKKKILIGTIIGLVILCICMFLTDKYMVEHCKEPLFVYKSKIANDGGSYTAKGLFYIINVQKNIYSDIEKIEMYVFDKCIAASITDFHYLPNEQNHLTSVIIKNNKISNENLIDEFIEKAINTNTKTETLEIVQDDAIIKLTYTPGEYAQLMVDSLTKNMKNIPTGNGSQEDYKRIYGYYTITINDEVKGDYSLTSHNIKRTTIDGIVTVYLDAPLIDYTDIIKICSYDLESSNYTKKFDINYNQRKDLGIKEIYDNEEYKLKTFGGNVNIIFEGEDAVYTLEDIINRKLINCEDILEQVKMDTKYGICQEGYYQDGGSAEYLYEDYTILKLNTLDGDKDLIIGMKGSILNSYNKNKDNIVSTAPYVPEGMQVADENYSSDIKATDVTFNRKPENVTIEVLEDTITNKSVEILITDTNEDSYGWGVEFRIQEKINGKWETLNYISEDLAWISIAYSLNEDNQLKQKLNIENYYGVLDKGIYRAVKPIYDNGYIDIYSNEFEIK